MSTDEVKRIEQDGDPNYYFNFGESKLKEKPRVILLQQSFKAFDEEGESWDNRITYSVCYGHSGKGLQSDWLFKQDQDGYIFYGDCSGDEWKGVRQYEGDIGYGGNDASINKEWSDLDSQAYEKLMSYWERFFCESEESDFYTIQDEYFNELSDEGVTWSDNFDHDILYDCTGIWDFLTIFEH